MTQAQTKSNYKCYALYVIIKYYGSYTQSSRVGCINRKMFLFKIKRLLELRRLKITVFCPLDKS